MHGDSSTVAMGGLKLTFRLGSKKPPGERRDPSDFSPKLVGIFPANDGQTMPPIVQGASRTQSFSTELHMTAAALSEVPPPPLRESGETTESFMTGVPRALGGSGGILRSSREGVEARKSNAKRKAGSGQLNRFSTPSTWEPQSTGGETVQRELLRGTNSTSVILKPSSGTGEKAENEGTMPLYLNNGERQGMVKKRKRNTHRRETFTERAMTRRMPALMSILSLAHASPDRHVPVVLPTNLYFQSQQLPEMYAKGLNTLTSTLSSLATETASTLSGVATVWAQNVCLPSPYPPIAPIPKSSDMLTKLLRASNTANHESESAARSKQQGDRLSFGHGGVSSIARTDRCTSTMMLSQAAAAAGARAKAEAKATEIILRGEASSSFEAIEACEDSLLSILTRMQAKASYRYVDAVRSIHAHLMDAMKGSKGSYKRSCDIATNSFCAASW